MDTSQFKYAVVAIVLCLAVLPTIHAATPDRDPQLDGRLEEERSNLGGGRSAPPQTEPPTTLEADTFHLVGYALEGYDGDSGLLGFHRACSQAFPGSRTCTVAEIHETTTVPEPPSGFRFAWVEPHGLDDHSARLADSSRSVRVVDPSGSSAASTDCVGWTSSSGSDLGMAIDLGGDGCYGGFFLVSCKESLAIACCAPPDKTLASRSD